MSAGAPDLDGRPADSYISGMGSYSVAEANDNLSALIDRALNGEDVVIVRDGAPVIAFRPIAEPEHLMNEADLEWLAARRVTPRRPVELDSGALISAMRDEDEH